VRQVHKASEKCFIDYCGVTTPVVSPSTGEVRQAQIFVAVLGSSNYTYVEATWGQLLRDWLQSHVRTFEFYGGTPRYWSPIIYAAASARSADGSYKRLLGQLAKIDLLIIDDWGLEPLSPAHRNDLMEIMDDRYGSTSTFMISQFPTDQWYASIGDNTLANAILDRLMHNAHKLNLQGESMRKRKSELTECEHPM
jgi:hypothetical protein